MHLKFLLHRMDLEMARIMCTPGSWAVGSEDAQKQLQELFPKLMEETGPEENPDVDGEDMDDDGQQSSESSDSADED